MGAVQVWIIERGSGAVLARTIEGGAGVDQVWIIVGGVGAVQVAKIGHLQHERRSAKSVRQFKGGLGMGGGEGVAVLRVTFWGGRGWELSSGLIPWAGEGVVHLRNHAKTPNLASLSSTIASPP